MSACNTYSVDRHRKVVQMKEYDYGSSYFEARQRHPSSQTSYRSSRGGKEGALGSRWEERDGQGRPDVLVLKSMVGVCGVCGG